MTEMMGSEQNKIPKVGKSKIYQNQSKYISHCTPFEPLFQAIVQKSEEERLLQPIAKLSSELLCRTKLEKEVLNNNGFRTLAMKEILMIISDITLSH